MVLAGGFGLLILILLIAGVSLKNSYNNLVSLNQGTDSQWAQVQNVYQRRADLIPNLVQTVQNSANFEKSILTAVTDGRASVGRVTIDASKAPTDAATLQQYQVAAGAIVQRPLASAICRRGVSRSEIHAGFP